METAAKDAAERVEATTRLLRAGWHPVQIKALTILTERVASPKEIAVDLGMTKAKAGNVSHHVKELVKRGLAELVYTEPRRGANEHFYRATAPLVISTRDAQRMSFEERLTFTCWIVSCISHDFVTAIQAGTIDSRIDRHLTRCPLELDEEGFRELVEEHERVFERTQEIQAAAERRMSEGGGSAMKVSAVVGSFPMPNGAESPDH